MRTLDYLPNTNICLYQDTDMFRFNSDTRYLGEFINIKKNDVVLDVGTNNGALLLYVNRIGCKKMIGVDINKSAILLCEENMKLNNITNVELYDCKVQDLRIDKVDVIVCNPPFYSNGLQKQNVNIRNARHDDSLSLEDLGKNCKRLLKDNGRLFLVYKANEIGKIFRVLNDNNFGIVRMQFVHDVNKNFSTCVLVEAVLFRKNDVKVINPIIITH